MDPFFKVYATCWVAACGLALALAARHGAAFAISRRAYWRLLAEPWKVAAFLCGAALITLVAPYTADPTWDYVDGAFMSVLCFTTAPWVVGILYRLGPGKAGWAEGYVAVCAWLFSASWSYDGYLLWRDGQYPATWHANLLASSVIYLSAGLFWNLEWVGERGVIFSFMRPQWPAKLAGRTIPPETSAPWHMALYAAIFALPAVLAVVVFFL